MVEIIRKPTGDEFYLILEKPKRYSSDQKVLIKRKKEKKKRTRHFRMV